MGAGNWYPTGHEEGWADYVYVDTYEVGDDEDDYNQFFEDLKVDIEALLPESYFHDQSRAMPLDLCGRDEIPFMRNHHMSVNFADNNGDIVVVFRYHEKRSNCNEADWSGKRTARKIVRELLRRYELRVRCGPWTSMRVEYPQDAISKYVGGGLFVRM